MALIAMTGASIQSASRRGTNILDLPNELINQIFGLVCSMLHRFAEVHGDRRYLGLFREVRTLALVCRPFHDRIMPIIYIRIFVPIGSVHVNWVRNWDGRLHSLPSRDLLHRSFSQNFSLRQHCGTLEISFTDIKPTRHSRFPSQRTSPPGWGKRHRSKLGGISEGLGRKLGRPLALLYETCHIYARYGVWARLPGARIISCAMIPKASVFL